MAKDKKTPFDLYDKQYNVEDLTKEQAIMFQHIGDLERKTNQLMFNLDQLATGKQAYIEKLNESLTKKEKETK
tara:strand:- start:296 stop:514 length:219 start_codon:yes stop_codon:yes gene_type:complete